MPRQRVVLAVLATAALAAACTSTPGAPESSPTTTGAAASRTSSAPQHSPTAGGSTPRSSAPGTHASDPAATSAPPRSAPSAPPAPRSAPATPSEGQGALVVLNPGHNGGNAAAAAQIAQPVPSGFGQSRACDTTGTATDAGYPEHAFNWDVGLRVRAILAAHGVRVVLTRPNDTGVGPCIDKRSAIGNTPQVAAAFVSIHADGAPSWAHGFHISEDGRQPAGPAVAAESHRLTVAIHDALVRGSGLSTPNYVGTDGYDPRTDFAGLNLAQGPATFLELGNMRNPGDAALQSSASGRQHIADAIAAGILAFLS